MRGLFVLLFAALLVGQRPIETAPQDSVARDSALVDSVWPDSTRPERLDTTLVQSDTTVISDTLKPLEKIQAQAEQMYLQLVVLRANIVNRLNAAEPVDDTVGRADTTGN